MKKAVMVCWLIAGVLLIGTVGLLKADEQAPSVSDSFSKLNNALEKDPNISPEVKKALKDFGEAMMKQEDKTAATAQGTQTKVAEWFSDEKNFKKFQNFFGGDKDNKGFLDRFSVNGDFRLRFEDTTNAGSKSGDPSRRDRGRYRARVRLGAEYQIAPTAWVGGRIVTGDRLEQQSANQTLGDDFSKWQINLDRLYLHWQPFAVAPCKVGDMTYDPHVWLGKFGHPFKSTNLMWSSDVQPEGAALINSFKNVGGFLDEIQLNLASYVLTEDADQQDAWIGAGQIAAIKKFNVGLPDKIQLTVAEAMYNINDTLTDAQKSEILSSSTPFKNPPTATSATKLQSDYQLLDSLIQLDYGGFELMGHKKPLKLFFDFIYNIGANSDKVNGLDDKQNKAYMVGTSFGDVAKKGDWRVGADYIYSQRDGVFKGITQDDWAVNNNFKGFDAYADYAVWDKAYFRVWALWDSPIAQQVGSTLSATTEQVSHFRLRFEFNVQF